MSVGLLTYTKNWENKEDFPTYQPSEETVRKDLQLLYDEIQTYLNETLVPALNEVISGAYAPASVDTAAIVDAAVTTAKIAALAITTALLADGSVTTAKLADAAVTQAKLGANAVSTSQLANLGVTTDKLAANAVTNAKLGSDIVPESVGFVVGTEDPTEDQSLLSIGQVYLKLES